MKQPSPLESAKEEARIKIQVFSPERSYYYDSKEKLLIEKETKLVIEPVSINHEIGLYSKVLENLTPIINKVSEDIVNALNIVKGNVHKKVIGLAEAKNFDEDQWLRHARVLSLNSLDPCLKIREDIENKIQELDKKLKAVTTKQETEREVHKHIKELIPVLDKALVDDYKLGFKDTNLGFYFVKPEVRTLFSRKDKKGKKIVGCGKFLCNTDGSLLVKSPVVHGKTMVHEVDSFDSLITEFLVYKRFTKGSDILIATISEIIDFYEEEWDIDLEESIKQDKIVPKKKPRASSFWDSF